MRESVNDVVYEVGSGLDINSWKTVEEILQIITQLKQCVSIVSLDRKVAASVYKTENTAVGIRHANHVAPTIRKSWQSLRRQAAVARSV
jgi:hypothetical protein